MPPCLRIATALLFIAVLLIAAPARAQRIAVEAPSPLAQAVTEGNLSAVQKALEAGGDPDVRYAMTVLPDASPSEPREGIMLAWRDTLVWNDTTPLMHAAFAGQAPIVRALLAAGAAPDAQGHEGMSALSLAALRGHEIALHALLRAGADPNVQDTGGSTPLVQAARLGHTEPVRLLLDAGADPNRSGRVGAALPAAVAFGHDRIPRLLLAAGADPDARGYDGETALMKAADDESETMTVLLLEAGADPSLRDTALSRTALMKAVDEYGGDLETVRALLAAGADPNAQDANGHTALMMGLRSTAATQALLEAGASVGLQDARGWTALDYAAARCRPEVHALLVRALERQAAPDASETYVVADRMPRVVGGAQAVRDSTRYPEWAHAYDMDEVVYVHFTVDAEGRVRLPEVQDCERQFTAEALRVAKALRYEPGERDGRPVSVRFTLPVRFEPPDSVAVVPSPYETGPPPSTLRAAVAQGDLAATQRLLQAGASLEARHDTSLGRGGYYSDALPLTGATPLMEAARRGDLAVARALLDAGADPGAATDEGWTPLMLAARDGHLWVTRLLLASDAAVEPQNASGETALLHAASAGVPAVVRTLLDAGADPNVRNDDQQTPILFATARGYTETAQALLAAGADPNVTSTYDPPPLFLALDQGHPEIARMLLDAGADPSVYSGDETPLMRAVGQGYAEVTRALLGAGINPNVQDGSGRTALMQVSDYTGNVTIVRMLLEAEADPDIMSARGVTALMHAAEWGNADIVQALLDAGANPALRSNDGKQALELAAEGAERNQSFAARDDAAQEQNPYKEIQRRLRQALPEAASTSEEN